MRTPAFALLCLLMSGTLQAQGRFSPYQPMYWHGLTGAPDGHVKLQFSGKYKVLDLWDADSQGSGLYMAYSARLLWDMWNPAASWPIYDVNHKPESFLRWKLEAPWGLEHLDAGYRHESNGGGNVPDPRDPGDLATKSYFQAYLRAGQSWTGERLRLRLNWEARHFHIDWENPDIADYLGRAAVEAELDFRLIQGADGGYLLDDNTLSFSTHSGFLRELASRHPAAPPGRVFSFEAGLALGLAPLMRWMGLDGSLHLFVQYFNGWGEYLSTYNDRREHRFYGGLTLRPQRPWR